MRSQCKAHVHAVLAKGGVWVPMTDLFGVEGNLLLLNESEGRRLLVGPMLAELNEFILLEPITKLTTHGASRDFSHSEHNGYHVPLHVRRRGGEEETLTLVLPFDVLTMTAEFLHGIANRTKTQAAEQVDDA